MKTKFDTLYDMVTTKERDHKHGIDKITYIMTKKGKRAAGIYTQDAAGKFLKDITHTYFNFKDITPQFDLLNETLIHTHKLDEGVLRDMWTTAKDVANKDVKDLAHPSTLLKPTQKYFQIPIFKNENNKFEIPSLIFLVRKIDKFIEKLGLSKDLNFTNIAKEDANKILQYFNAHKPHDSVSPIINKAESIGEPITDIDQAFDNTDTANILVDDFKYTHLGSEF